MKTKELLLWLLIIIAIFCISNYNEFFDGDYQGDVISEKFSDNHKYKAIKTEKSSGATTRFTYHLILIESEERLTNSSFVIFTTYENFDYYWDSGNLVVVTNENSKIFKQETNYNGIQIIYKNQN